MELGKQLLVAISLMLILEGVLPFLYPQRWRNLVEKLSGINDRQLRMAGLLSMIAGLIVLTIAT